MVKGEKFEKDGKTYEVTAVFGSNFAFKEAKKDDIPVVAIDKPKKTGKKKG